MWESENWPYLEKIFAENIKYKYFFSLKPDFWSFVPQEIETNYNTGMRNVMIKKTFR